MAESYLYLTTRGRTTGLPREIEIWFVEHAGRHYLVAQNRERAQWVQNIEHDPNISFSVGTRDAPEAVLPRRSGKGRIVRAQAEPELARAVSALMDEKYDWSDGLIVELSGGSASAE